MSRLNVNLKNTGKENSRQGPQYSRLFKLPEKMYFTAFIRLTINIFGSNMLFPRIVSGLKLTCALPEDPPFFYHIFFWILVIMAVFFLSEDNK